jgi:hypothetical protein
MRIYRRGIDRRRIDRMDNRRVNSMINSGVNIRNNRLNNRRWIYRMNNN